MMKSFRHDSSSEPPDDPAPDPDHSAASADGSPGTTRWRFPNVDRHNYTFGDEVGRGGQGRIVLAHDRRLNRTIAIKELAGAEPHQRRRFQREALITAKLQHPAIVPVHEAGCWSDGQPFYAMKFVSGEALSAMIERLPTLHERMALLPSILTVTDALSFAHANGVIHRDLKPGNVIMGSFGETIVIDWGLAKVMPDSAFVSGDPDFAAELSNEDLDRQAEAGGDDETVVIYPGDSQLTMQGGIMGTPAYMSPEQARGEEADRRSDVYSLGAILFHLLTGRPPYDGMSPLEILTHTVKGGAVDLGGLREGGIPDDLATIVKKAMAKEPAERYADAHDLATELRRYQTGQLVSSHSYTSSQLFLRWARRYRGVLAVSAVAGILLTLFGIIGVQRIVTERDQAEVAQARAAARADEITIVQARSWLERDPSVALAWLKGLSVDSDRWSAARLIASEAVASGVYRVHGAHEGRVWKALYMPNGIDFVSAGDDGVVNLWRQDGGEPTRMAEHKGLIKSVAMTADGTWIASASFDQSVRLWNPATQEIRVLRGHRDAVSHIAAAPQGPWFASSSWDGTLRLWNTETGESRILSGHEGRVNHVAFAPDGARVISGGQDGTVRLWQVEDGSVTVLAGHEAAVDKVRVAPDGSTIASASQDHTIRLWTADGEPLAVLAGHDNTVTDIRFSPANDRLASTSLDRSVRLWDLNTWEGFRLHGATGEEHNGEVLVVAFSPNGELLASGSVDRSVRLWRLNTLERDAASQDWKLQTLGFTEHDDWVLHVGFSPDGKRLLSTSTDGTIREWTVPPARSTLLRGHQRGVLSIALSPRADMLVSGSLDNTVRVWDLASGAQRAFTGHDGGVRRVAFSPSGDRIASAGGDGTVRIWEVETGEALVLRGHEAGVECVAFHPDGDMLASSGLDNTVRLWNPATRQDRVLRGHEGKVSWICFSPDGRLLASVGSDAYARVWDLDAGTSRTLEGHSGWILHAAFDADGRVLATAGSDGSVRLWDLTDGTSRVLTGHSGWVRHLAFSPDGARLVSAGADGSVRSWDLDAGRDLLLIDSIGDVKHVAFSPDGSLLAAACADGVLREWDVATGEMRALPGHEAEIESVVYEHDGDAVVTAGLDGRLRRWRDDVPRNPGTLRSLLFLWTNASIGANNEVVFP